MGARAQAPGHPCRKDAPLGLDHARDVQPLVAGAPKFFAHRAVLGRRCEARREVALTDWGQVRRDGLWLPGSLISEPPNAGADFRNLGGELAVAARAAEATEALPPCPIAVCRVGPQRRVA